MIGQTISHYKILEKFGEGGMGVVYKAHDTKLDRMVALKCFPVRDSGAEPGTERYLHEARAASKINHPHISHVYEVDESGDIAFIAMEFVEGGNLRSRIRSGPMELRSTLRIASQIASGLQAAHEQSIIHRDIKPENILFARDGSVKLVDFGLALTGRSPGTESVSGTVRYMSPEQIGGEEIGPASDIWSLGIVLYEMVAGRVPFEGEYDQAIFYAILHEPHPPISDVRQNVPKVVQEIVNRCLEKLPSNRFADARSLGEELRRIEGTLFAADGTPRTALKSIAVLPFKDISPHGDNKYFSDGLTEEIIANLSKLGELKVVSRTSAMRYDGVEKPVTEIASELGVQFILEGSVRKHGSDLRITAELVDAVQDASMWAETYRGTMEEVFDIQEQVASRIVTGLQMRLTTTQRRSLNKRFTKSPEAYQLYLKGRFFWNKRTEQAITTAIRYFEQAIEKDPEYAVAWAGLADAYNLISEYGHTARHEVSPKAKMAVHEALRIDDGLAEAHTSLASVLMLNEWNWDGAEKEYKLAIQLNPNYATAHHWLAELYSLKGMHEDSIREIIRAIELDPVSVAMVKDKGLILYYARRYQEAIDEGKKALELDATFFSAHRLLSLAYAAVGRYDEAIEENRLWGEAPGYKDHAAASLAYILALSGKKAEALNVLGTVQVAGTSAGNLARACAIVHGALGNIDEAVRLLGKAFELGADSLSTLKVDPKIDPLRADPGFKALMRKTNMAS